MGKNAQTIKRIIRNTQKNIVRNKWLSSASIIVISLTFMISTTLIGLVLISSNTISAFEKKAQIILFFENDTREEDIMQIKDTLEATDLLEDIEYISQEDALEIYKEDFEDDPTLVESVTADALPPSLGLRTTNIEDVTEVIRICDQLKEDNPIIEEIMYFKDVVDALKGISKVIKIGGVALVVALCLTSSVLILITIGFNINAHKKEIEVMQLLGSTDNYIRIPFLLEGAIYGLIGAATSATILLTIWYVGMHLLQDNNMFLFISQTFNEIGMPYLKQVNWQFIGIVFSVEVIAGGTIGFISSSLAIWKYLR
ncbi:MAG: permease-like cell division protein FtsX [Patescibacteria group bacterium]|nr:permease-like cell division protein FtsX [Patescibacteria group bacterium]